MFFCFYIAAFGK